MLNPAYWTQRYQDHQTGWDIGYASPAIVDFIVKNANLNDRILIPGAGNAYEAEYLFKKGFSNIYILDYSELPLKQFQTKNPEFPKEQILCQDFFEHTGNYDWIIEQTFFCALDPNLRSNYVKKMWELLKDNGSLIGLWFASEFKTPGPPFGGSKEEYLGLFENSFQILESDICQNSIPPRLGNEIFFHFKK